MRMHYRWVVFMATALVGASLIHAQEPDVADPAQKPKAPDDLAAKLIRQAAEDSSNRDPMSELIQSMGEIARKLQEEFDPGEHTQARQRDVMARLEQAIKEAAARRQARAQAQPRSTADKRTMQPSGKPQPKSGAKKPGPDGTTQSKPGTTGTETAASKQDQEGAVPKSRKGWGNLPDRDREEFLQGADEEYLERFRPWVEQYFRALQESNR